MQVEVYCEQEVLQQTEEENAEAARLRAQLELEQREEVPYREWTDDEAFVYGQLLKTHTKLKEFKGAVPLRVLQVAAHAKTLDCIGGLEV